MSRTPRPPRFDARWNRKRQSRARWRRMRWLGALLGLGVLLALAYLLPQPERAVWSPTSATFRACADRGEGPCAIDGDTLAIGPRRIRLAGYDAPELDGACAAERAKAIEARTALVGWLNRAPFEWDGGAEPPHDRYGRDLRSVRRGGEDLAWHMIDSGLASENGWGAMPIDWCRG